jgi:hypothetical protein
MFHYIEVFLYVYMDFNKDIYTLIRKRIEEENRNAALLEINKRKLKVSPKGRPMDDSTEG